MSLDFSKLDKVSYRGFEGKEAEKDRLIEQGFTILEGEKTPFDAPERATSSQQSSLVNMTQQHNAAAKTAPRAALQPFKSLDGTRDYRKLYRIACNFHERYNSPPIVAKSSEEYSRYWQAVTDDMFATIAANDKDPFLAAMLGAVYDELEREQEQPEKSK